MRRQHLKQEFESATHTISVEGLKMLHHECLLFNLFYLLIFTFLFFLFFTYLFILIYLEAKMWKKNQMLNQSSKNIFHFNRTTNCMLYSQIFATNIRLRTRMNSTFEHLTHISWRGKREESPKDFKRCVKERGILLKRHLW